MRRTGQAILLAMVWCRGVVSLHAETPGDSLVGKWQHTSGKVRLMIEGNRLHFVCEGVDSIDGRDVGFSLHADYGRTRDQIVFGLITRVEVDAERLRADYGLELVNEPIAFRVRVEDGVLVIHDANISDLSRHLLEGVYKPAGVADKPAAKKEKVAGTPRLTTPVPSCSLYGNRLDNFALYDLAGKVREYKKHNPRARLTLLDFWYHNCQPCLQAIPHLVELQRDFGPYGLEVIGIACETGTVAEQRQHVQAIRGRYGINYPLLLSGGGPEHSPVMKQFDVQFYPLLVLIDADGTILWRSTRDGVDDLEHYKLEKMIAAKLLTGHKDKN